MEISQVPPEDVRTCLGSSTPPSPDTPHQTGLSGVAFGQLDSLGTSNFRLFVALWPTSARAPVNAQPPSSRMTVHDSG